MAESRGRRTLSTRTSALVVAAALAAGACATTSAPPPPASPEPQPEMVVAGPLPGGELPRARDELRRGLGAVQRGNPDAAYGHLTAVLDQCGASSVGQQALLALAAVELDPTNRDPRLDLAAEAAAQVAARQGPASWPGQVSRTLYGLALRMGASPVGGVLPGAIELHGGSVGFDAEPERPAADCESTEAWPGPGLAAPADVPSVGGASYPARLATLQRRVNELEEELERLRRLTRP